MLDAHQLNVFLIAAETLNFTHAAQRLHMTQPSVSQHIKALEKHFGMKLFIRAGRNIELTDAGVALVPMARELIQQSIYTEEAMASLLDGVYGHLLVGCSTTPGKYVLPQLLANFHRAHPKVKVTCNVTPQSKALEMLCNGDVHFALASTTLGETTKAAEFRNFMTDPVLLIAPLDHPWAQRSVVDPEELSEADFILREDGSGTMNAVLEGLAKIDVSKDELNTLLTLGNSEAIAMAVQEGLGVGFVSSLVFTRLVADRVATVDVRGLEIRRDIYIGRQKRRPATAAQIAFWAFICGLEDPTFNRTDPEKLKEEVLQLIKE
jgi:DNA-binding transcriptional LysR family regulator